MPLLNRRSDIFIAFIILQVMVIALIFIDAAVRARLAAPGLQQRRQAVAVLALTDLALFTEARYTRHPSMADRNTPFQDHPLALEHFPSGSLVPLPAHLANPSQPENHGRHR